MPTGKIGVYTRFFEFANFQLPLFTFLVNVLRNYRINLSQLSVIATDKVSHFEILCRVHGIEPTVGLFRFFYVDSLACPASFPWHTDKNVSKDPCTKSTELSADDYAVIVAHPAPFQKFLESFLCLIGMSRNYTLDEDTYPIFLRDDRTEMDLFVFIQVMDPTKVKVGEQKRAKDEARLWDFTVGRVVSLLLVVLARSESELEASIERLFDEGGSANHEDSAASGGQEAKTGIVTGVRIVADENVVAERFKCPRKKRQAVTDASVLLILLRDQGETTELLVRPLLAVNLLSATLEHEGYVPADSITGLNIRTIGASERPDVVPSVMTEAVVTFYAVNIPPVREMEFNVGTARQACLNAKVRMRTNYCLSEKKRLESECEKQTGLLKAKDDEVENLKARLLLKEAEAAEIKKFQDVQMNIVNDKVAQLDADLLEMALRLKEKFYPTSLPLYLAPLAVPLRKECRMGCLPVLTMRLSKVDFSLLAELKSHNDASVEDIMNLLRLEGPLADALGMSDLQPHVDQLMLPVYRFEDQVVLGEMSLSFAISVTHSRVERIIENVVAKRSAFIGVWTPLVDPLSVENLMGEAGTSNGTDGPEDSQGNGQGNVASFPTVDFEKEELETTLERDSPS
nr:hypothetical protein [Tanacetum cinerariifolium]